MLGVVLGSGGIGPRPSNFRWYGRRGQVGQAMRDARRFTTDLTGGIALGLSIAAIETVVWVIPSKVGRLDKFGFAVAGLAASYMLVFGIAFLVHLASGQWYHWRCAFTVRADGVVEVHLRCRVLYETGGPWLQIIGPNGFRAEALTIQKLGRNTPTRHASNTGYGVVLEGSLALPPGKYQFRWLAEVPGRKHPILLTKAKRQFPQSPVSPDPSNAPY